jgi:alpha-L-fucosidase
VCSSDLNPNPWQTDTSIGDWYYNRDWKFRPVSWSIHMLVDIVSKNGCLLLNVVQRPDGSLDAEVEQALEEMAKWNAVFAEVIYGTRPWLVYGEGAVKAKGGHFGEDFAYTSKDIRFTTKDKTLYATALGWPADGQLVIKSLAKPANEDINNIRKVSMVGYDGKVEWTQTAEGLVVKVPAQKISEYTCAVRITGTDLKPVKFEIPVEPVKADPQGTIKLIADKAQLHGEQVKTEEKGGEVNLGFWDKAEEWVSWKLIVPAAGPFKVTAEIATVFDNSEFVVEIAGQKLNCKAALTGGWEDFKTVELGKVEIKEAGNQTLSVKPVPEKWHAINLRNIKLLKAQ